MKKGTIIAAAVLCLLLLSSMTSCKKKSDEEKVEALTEKLLNAKTEREVEEIANKIEKLEKKTEKKNTKEIKVKLGEPFTFWDYEQFSDQKISQYSLTFEKALYEGEKNPYGTGYESPPPGRTYVKVTFSYKNLGPRAGQPSVRAEIKLNDSSLCHEKQMYWSKYQSTSSMSGSTEQGETGKGHLIFEIPQGKTPVEVIGTVGSPFPEIGMSYTFNPSEPGTHFRLKIPDLSPSQRLGKSGKEDEKITENRSKMSEGSKRGLISRIKNGFSKIKGLLVRKSEKKSNEGKQDALFEKLLGSKSEKEADEIAKNIDKLDKENKANIKEIIVILGKQFTFQKLGEGMETEFRITFMNPVIDLYHPYMPDYVEYLRGQKQPYRKTPQNRASQGNKCFGIVAKVENLGPREGVCYAGLELKVDKGYIYPLAGKFVTKPPEKDSTDFPQEIYSLKQGGTGWTLCYCEIPEDTTPIEISGMLSGDMSGTSGVTKLRMKLTKIEGKIAESENKETETKSFFQRLFRPWWSTNKNENKENIIPNTQVPKENITEKSKSVEYNPEKMEQTNIQNATSAKSLSQNTDTSSKTVNSVESISPVQMLNRQRRRQPVEYQKIEASGNNANANIIKTQENLNMLHNAVTQFKIDTGRYPAENLGLLELIKQPTDVTGWKQWGYLTTKEIPKDAWGNDFIYQVYPERGKPFVIISYGADAKKGGDGDNTDLYSTDKVKDYGL